MTVGAYPLQGDPSSRKVRGGDKEVVKYSYHLRYECNTNRTWVLPVMQVRNPASESAYADEVLRLMSTYSNLDHQLRYSDLSRSSVLQ